MKKLIGLLERFLVRTTALQKRTESLSICDLKYQLSLVQSSKFKASFTWRDATPETVLLYSIKTDFSSNFYLRKIHSVDNQRRNLKLIDVVYEAKTTRSFGSVPSDVYHLYIVDQLGCISHDVGLRCVGLRVYPEAAIHKGCTPPLMTSDRHRIIVSSLFRLGLRIDGGIRTDFNNVRYGLRPDYGSLH